MGGDHGGHGPSGGDFRQKVWSMTGGPYCRPVHWRRNTAIAMVGIFLVCIPIAMKSAELEALLVSDFGPKILFRIVDTLRDEIRDGKLKSGTEIKASLKRCILELLTTKGSKTELQLGFRKPAVIMIVGVNGGGKTTSLGKLAYRFKNQGAKVLMAAGDTFRAAARDQLEIWAERTRGHRRS